MGVFGIKGDQGQAVLGACKHASSQLILKALWRVGIITSLQMKGLRIRVVGLPKVTWLTYDLAGILTQGGLASKFLPLSLQDCHS